MQELSSWQLHLLETLWLCELNGKCWDKVLQEGADWPAPLPLRQTSQCDAHDVLGSTQGRRHSGGDVPCAPPQPPASPVKELSASNPQGQGSPWTPANGSKSLQVLVQSQFTFCLVWMHVLVYSSAAFSYPEII